MTHNVLEKHTVLLSKNLNLTKLFLEIQIQIPDDRICERLADIDRNFVFFSVCKQWWIFQTIQLGKEPSLNLSWATTDSLRLKWSQKRIDSDFCLLD